MQNTQKTIHNENASEDSLNQMTEEESKPQEVYTLANFPPPFIIH